MIAEFSMSIPTWTELWVQMLPVATFGFAIFVYGLIIWYFYRSLAKRDLFSLNLKKYEKQKHAALKKLIGFISYLIEYVIVFPVITFLWFLVLALFLFLLAKSQSIQGILLISMALVSGVRIAAYYSEDLSRDLAKLLPFALLGIALVDPSFFSLQLFFDRLTEVIGFLPSTINFILFIILLESALKVLLVTKLIVVGPSKEKSV